MCWRSCRYPAVPFMIAGVIVPPLTDPEGGFRWGIGELSMSTMRTIVGRLSWVQEGVIQA